MLQPSQPKPTTQHGIPNADLRAMSRSQLQKRFTELHVALCKDQFTPRYLRAKPDVNAKHQRNLQASEHSRIIAIADSRNWQLNYPTRDEIRVRLNLQTASERELNIGDRVHAEYRNPDSYEHEIVRSDGEIIRTFNGRYGTMFITKLDNGQELPLSARNLTRIEINS